MSADAWSSDVCSDAQGSGGGARPGSTEGVNPWATLLLGRVGLSSTRARCLVLDVLRGRQRPMTAQDVHGELRARLRRQGRGERAVGITTVYRVIAGLFEHGVLHRFHRNGDAGAYRFCSPGRHDHLICRACGRVQEHPAGPLDKLGDRFAGADGFVVEDCRTEIVGLCRSCCDRYAENATDRGPFLPPRTAADPYQHHHHHWTGGRPAGR